jgi:protein-disulfide isomerase
MSEQHPRATLLDAVSERDHALGPAGAAITAVVYGDYECPYTRLAHTALLRARTALGDELRYVYRHLPLRAIHPHAQQAAEAAEAAAAQGRFWEMHDRLFRHQNALDLPSLAAHAAALGLQQVQFERDLAGHVFAARVEADAVSARRHAILHTPTTYVNGTLYEGRLHPRLLERFAELPGTLGA